MTHIMIDLETLGTAADSVILSIGAVKFDLHRGAVDDDNGFYRAVSVESNLAWNRRVSETTLQWWFEQSPQAQRVFFGEKQTLENALVQLSEWIVHKDPVMWSNGADFDLPMLAHAYNTCGIPTPWNFWQSRCYRTYKNLPGARALKLPALGTKHDALDDARSQAHTLCAIHKGLFPPHT